MSLTNRTCLTRSRTGWTNPRCCPWNRSGNCLWNCPGNWTLGLLGGVGFLLLGQFAHFGADNTHMRLRFVQRTDCDALAQLVTPCLRQVRGGDIGGLHFVRKLKSKEIGRHATINGYGAVAISHVVVRLAPRVHAPAGAGQCQHGKNAGNNHRKLIAALLGARGLLLLDLLIADGFGHIRVVGSADRRPSGFCTTGISPVSGLARSPVSSRTVDGCTTRVDDGLAVVCVVSASCALAG